MWTQYHPNLFHSRKLSFAGTSKVHRIQKMHALLELSSVVTAYKHREVSLGWNTREIFIPLAARSCNLVDCNKSENRSTLRKPGLAIAVTKIVSL